jgi:hypothetical protein
VGSRPRGNAWIVAGKSEIAASGSRGLPEGGPSGGGLDGGETSGGSSVAGLGGASTSVGLIAEAVDFDAGSEWVPEPSIQHQFNEQW